MNSRPIKLLPFTNISGKKNFNISKNVLRDLRLYKSACMRLFCTSKMNQVSKEERIIKGDGAIARRIDAYLRLVRFDKQIGTKLLLLPCYWSICIASPIGGLPNIFNLSLFTMGALCARSAGCIRILIN